MDWPVVLGLGAALVAGAFVQSSIGFGLAVVAAPFVVVLAPDLMPGALLVASFSLPVAQLLLAPLDIAWRPLGCALVARLAFTPLGVLAVAGELALAWLLHQPGVTGPITGPRTMEQLESAVASVDVALDSDDLARLDEIFPGHRTAPEDYAW